MNIQKNSINNLWKNIYDAIKWFKNINNKRNTTFIQFNIMDFYPSIMKELLFNSINLARNFIDITDEQLEIILNRRKSSIHYKNSTWIKSITENFDVPMNAYDCANH